MAPEAIDVMRQNYKALSDAEKVNMAAVKQHGAALHDLISAMGNSREISLAKTKVEEPVMWATNHITA